MQFIKLEQLSAQILNNKDAVLNLSYLELRDSHIIELLPTFSRLQQNITIDLTHNKITDFGAIMLIAKLNTTQRLRLENNNLTDDFLPELSKHTWPHNLEISINILGEQTKIFQLTDYSKKTQSDFSMLNQLFSVHIESMYQNVDIAKNSMLNFLLNCVKYWRSDYIQDQSYQQIITRKLLPGNYSTNQKLTDLFNILVTVVDYAAEIERLVNVYKDFIKSGKPKAESLLLKEIFSLITSIDDSELVEHDHYDSYDFICDVFDYFIKRYNDEIDNSYFYCTSPSWQNFIKDLRHFFSTHIQVNRFDTNEESAQEIQVWEKVKSRSIFTLHRNKCSRLLSYFSGYLAGRTQTLISIDNSIAWLRNGAPASANALEASIENVRNIKQEKLRFFKTQPADAFTQLLSAIRIHDRTRVAQLLNNSDLIEQVDVDFWSPIHHWAASDAVDREILTLLLAAKPTIIHDIIKMTGWNAAFVVINNCAGDSAVKMQKLELLCQYEIDCSITDTLSGKLPIHYAVMSDEERLIELLYKFNSASLRITDDQKKTPRDYAVPGSVAETLLSYYQAPRGEDVAPEWVTIKL